MACSTNKFHTTFPRPKEEVEQKILDICAQHEVELIILAKYMQILTDNFVSHYPNQIINIHHSFLPSFIGANPYKQAWERGVKLVGATSHYVTSIFMVTYNTNDFGRNFTTLYS